MQNRYTLKHQESHPDPIAKALDINMDPEKYGTFAEIGAGQEVARLFFRAGSASQTVAKTMSAYDMVFSDSIYGTEPDNRYVSQSRVDKMLAHEFSLLEERLFNKRTTPTAYFVFADTVTTRSANRKGYSHGWLGVRFQHLPGAQPSQVSIHANLLDPTVLDQQNVIGILGVNLLYGSFYHYQDPKKIISHLFDNLSSKSLEVDFVNFSGPIFNQLDNRELNLHLLHFNMTGAVMFSEKGDPVAATELLFRKNILTCRGAFRPFTRLHESMLLKAKNQFCLEEGVNAKDALALCEISHQEMKSSSKDFLAEFYSRLTSINAMGYPLLISNYFEYYRLANYFSRFSDKVMGYTLGMRNILEIFNERFYEHLPGGILESFGVLFKRQVKFYVYPMVDPQSKSLYTCDNVPINESLKHLYLHLRAHGFVKDISDYEPNVLTIFSSTVMEKIASNDSSWHELVPKVVKENIEKSNYYRQSS